MVRRREQIDGGGIGDYFYIRMRLHSLEKGPFNGKTSTILEMNDARDGMARLGRQIEFLWIFRGRVERNVQLVDQNFLYEARAFHAQQESRFRRAEPRPCGKDIRHELFRLFVVASIDDAALRPVRVAVLGIVG